MMFKRIESFSDVERGTVTYDLGDGRFAAFDRRDVEKYGIAELMRDYGIEMPTNRLPVIYHGRRVGTLAPDFDPAFARSRSFMYDVRPGDFRREGDTWIAANNMGAGDFDCVVGFIRETAE
jgi:hypothetical protein